MDVGCELLAAIGEVVVEATKLEHALARLVAVRCGWDEEKELSMITRTGGALDAMKKLAKAAPDWQAARRLYRDARAVSLSG